MVGALNPCPQAKRSLLPISLTRSAPEARPVSALPNTLLSSQRSPPPRKTRSKTDRSSCPNNASVLSVSEKALGNVPWVTFVPDSLRYSHPSDSVFHFGIVNVLRRSPCTRDVVVRELIVSV